jgi:23S rRNA pseudouridine955/2504/2580 synthase
MKDIPVLFDNDEILVVNKPSGIPVQGGQGVTVTIIDILERQTGIKIYPVHRLDKDTAGILVTAKSSRAAAEYSRHIEEGLFVKEYIAVCFGEPGKDAGVIQLPAGKSGNEKPAQTFWCLLASANGYSVLSLRLGTGRMHQIRSHLASIGCPILADDKYGDFARNRKIRSEFNIRKLQLAACALSFPAEKNETRIVIPLPGHLASCIDILGLPYIHAVY